MFYSNTRSSLIALACLGCWRGLFHWASAAGSNSVMIKSSSNKATGMTYSAICAVARDENRYIREWVLYHLCIGEWSVDVTDKHAWANAPHWSVHGQAGMPCLVHAPKRPRILSYAIKKPTVDFIILGDCMSFLHTSFLQICNAGIGHIHIYDHG